MFRRFFVIPAAAGIRVFIFSWISSLDDIASTAKSFGSVSSESAVGNYS
jgi:Ca2+/Na+ antiporter